MFKKITTSFLLVFFVVCAFGGMSWAKGKREALKEQFAPSMNMRQIQNVGPEEIQYEPYYKNNEQLARASQTRVSAPVVGEYAIYQSEYETKIEEDIAFIKGRVNLEVFKKTGYVKIPLAASSVGLKEVSLNRKASFVIREGNQYVLLINKPGLYSLDVEFFVKVKREREHGPGSLSFKVLPSPISILDVEMEEKEVEIFVEPSIKIEAERAPKKTLATVVLPYTERVMIRWSKSLPKEIITKVQLEPKLYVETVTLVSVGDGVAKCFSRLNYSILQSEVSNLRFSLPEDVGVLDVSGRELRDWKIETKGGRQIVDAYLNYGVKGNYTLNVLYERSIGEGSVTAQLPQINVLGTKRQRGFVGVEALTNIELAVNQLKEASVIDVKELPQQIWSRARNPVLLAFKYLKVPYEAVIDVTKHQELPVLIATIDSANYVTLLTDEGKTLTKVTYHMRNNVKQFVKLSLPKKAELWSCFVAGKPVKPAKDKEGKILIPLEKSQSSGEALTQFPVEVVYLTKNSKLGAVGKLALSLPKVDIPSSELLWSLYLPEKFGYFRFGGDVAIMEKRGRWGQRQFAAGGSVSSADEDKRVRIHRYDKMRKKLNQMADIGSQVEMEEQVFDAVSVAQGRGALPIKINISEKGKLYRFSKLLVTDESPRVSAFYIRLPKAITNIFKLLILVGFVGVIVHFIRKKGVAK